MIIKLDIFSPKFFNSSEVSVGKALIAIAIWKSARKTSAIVVFLHSTLFTAFFAGSRTFARASTFAQKFRLFVKVRKVWFIALESAINI